MSKIQRVALAAGVVLLDSLVFFLPLTAFFLAYLIIVNPPWFKDFLIKLDGPGQE